MNTNEKRLKKNLQTKRGTRPSAVDAREDGQEAHPQRACTGRTNSISQAAAAFERRLFWLLFVSVQKVTSPDTARIVHPQRIPAWSALKKLRFETTNEHEFARIEKLERFATEAQRHRGNDGKRTGCNHELTLIDTNGMNTNERG
jgi:hypothetical protein